MAECCEAGAGVPGDSGYKRALWAVLLINGVMFGIEGVAGLIAGSVSLQADALDFLGDAATYAITLLVLGRSIRWRAGAAILKGSAMSLFGLGVRASAAYRALVVGVPSAEIMVSVGALALAANLVAAAILYRFRAGDSNRRSVWLCTRNDAIANAMVIAAAALVATTGSGLPDLAVGIAIAALALSGAAAVLRQARAELAAAPRRGIQQAAE